MIGLTGGIACGKSEVAKMLEELGAQVLDADRIAREVLAAGSPTLARVVSRFGPQMLRADGSLDRPRLGRLVFNDPEALADLNDITHPVVIDVIRQRLEVARREKVGVVVVDAPLLFEAGMEDLVDEVWVVACERHQQIERLCQRDGLPPEEAEARLRAQMPLEEKVHRADRVIYNDGSLDRTRSQVVASWREATTCTGAEGRRWLDQAKGT